MSVRRLLIALTAGWMLIAASPVASAETPEPSPSPTVSGTAATPTSVPTPTTTPSQTTAAPAATPAPSSMSPPPSTTSPDATTTPVHTTRPTAAASSTPSKAGRRVAPEGKETYLYVSLSTDHLTLGETVTVLVALGYGDRHPLPGRPVHLRNDRGDLDKVLTTGRDGEAELTWTPTRSGANWISASFDETAGFDEASDETFLWVQQTGVTPTLTIKASPARAHPGDTVTLTGRYLDKDGRPVAAATLLVSSFAFGEVDLMPVTRADGTWSITARPRRIFAAPGDLPIPVYVFAPGEHSASIEALGVTTLTLVVTADPEPSPSWPDDDPSSPADPRPSGFPTRFRPTMPAQAPATSDVTLAATGSPAGIPVALTLGVLCVAGGVVLLARRR